ncbi:MAG: hypothetical protein B9J98_06075 [Candidatus Terraquivivens tikiterensis]|uniref:Cupin type-2 domain-containing protein n=1 Tax=Candidatus Terraquivivens tikiterensis TaxID=1980982 RepID=A0A2R7Y3V5_9ARCH|nr:MAG: hypothetical protein B9J98_06075 [Candidatus Terraquivivens tikiterensis]
MSVKSSDSIGWENVPDAVKAEMKRLISRHDGAQNFEMRKFVIRAGGRLPKHMHPDMEHEQYVLKGDYLVGIGEVTYRVKPGDVIFIPPGTPHWYSNPGPEDAEFICVIPKRETVKTVNLE